jgi:hypothetical protein
MTTRLCCRAHARISSSGAVFDQRDYAFTLSHPAIPEVTLHCTTFGDLTDDNDDALVYGGIHFRFDQEAGARQGRRVGAERRILLFRWTDPDLDPLRTNPRFARLVHRMGLPVEPLVALGR